MYIIAHSKFFEKCSTIPLWIMANFLPLDGTAAHIPSLDTHPLGCPTLGSSKDGNVVG